MVDNVLTLLFTKGYQTMLKRIIPFTALLIIGATITASALSDSERSDCPGKIICPLTGELVCKDKCPLDANETQLEDQQAQLPECCRKE